MHSIFEWMQFFFSQVLVSEIWIKWGGGVILCVYVLFYWVCAKFDRKIFGSTYRLIVWLLWSWNSKTCFSSSFFLFWNIFHISIRISSVYTTLDWLKYYAIRGLGRTIFIRTIAPRYLSVCKLLWVSVCVFVCF